MERILTVGLLFCLGHNSVWAKTDIYFVVGKSLQLRPPSSVTTIDSIAWRHKGNFVAEWVENKIPLEFYGTFQGRTSLNTKTGLLQINDTTENDAGEFSVEINSKTLDELYVATAIEEVPKPAVWVRPAEDNWTLTCEGNVDKAGPVTYLWDIVEDVEWAQFDRRVDIPNNKTTRSLKTFSCKIVNPVSEQESEPKENPFYGTEVSSAVAAGCGVLFVIVLIAVGLGCWKKEAIKTCFSSLRSGSNGNVAPGCPEAVTLNDKDGSKTSA